LIGVEPKLADFNRVCGKSVAKFGKRYAVAIVVMLYS
jgi:hypothetical protein